MASYTLALLKAQSPTELLGCKVVSRVYDEQASGRYRVENERPDILCLTYLTTGAPRAYEISEEAKRTTSHDGDPVRVIHGGVHATNLPKEALLHSNLVVRGETTPEFQAQLLATAMQMSRDDKDVLRMTQLPKTLSRPPADWSWMNRKDYMLAPSIQTSVGCPFGCDFCSVTEVFGPGMRVVEDESLRLELDQHHPKTILAIVDDNFLQGSQPQHIERCIKVVRMLRERKLRWVAELTVRTLIDARKKLLAASPSIDIIERFAASGCIGLYFGIESVSEEETGLTKLRGNKETLELLHVCQANGLGVLGAFVLGVGPDETPEYAKRLLDYAVNDAKLDFAQFSINTPMPGARNFLTGIRDNLIFNFDWELYDAEHCVMRHPRMSPTQLEDAHHWLYQEFYSRKNILKKYQFASLLTLNPLMWRRFALGVPGGMYLHQTAKKWVHRLQNEEPRELISDPHSTVLDQVNEALESNREHPRALFSVRDLQKEDHLVNA
jgi:radical SAM superfamily enzyme YgiQ (UPF0313 family)